MHDRARDIILGAICGGALLLLPPMAASPAWAQAGTSITTKKVDTKPAEADTDAYIPPLRGTPDGRISGATRGAQPITALKKPNPVN